MSNMFVHYLTRVAASNVFNPTFLAFMASTIPGYSTLLLPVSLFLSIVLVYGRLFANNELRVSMSCGMSWLQLIRITLVPVYILAVLVAVLSLFVVPKLYGQRIRFSNNSANVQRNLNLIKPGRFVSFSHGAKIAYIGDSSKDHGINNIFLYQRTSHGGAQIIMSPHGYVSHQPPYKDAFVLQKGVQYKIPDGNEAVQIINFESYAALLTKKSHHVASHNVHVMSTWKLLKTNSTAASAELQWRISLPLAVIVLACIAIALCHIKPRSGQYGKMIPAILLFALYFNSLSVSKVWLKQGILSPFIGLWWVHILFCTLSVLWLSHLNGGIFKKRLGRKISFNI